MTWDDATAFCQWLSQVTGVEHRLPTEAQWEAAARGGLVGQLYPWGSEAPDAGGGYRANYRPNDSPDDGFAFRRPGRFVPSNRYGLFDMAGNVSEWCQDRYVPLQHRRPVQARGLCASSRAAPGSLGPGTCAAAARQSAPPDYADGYIGFRVVRLPHP